MRNLLYFLLFFAWALVLAVLSQPIWERIVSVQGKVDPNTLAENYDPNARVGIFNNEPVDVPQSETAVLGESSVVAISNASKYIEVDLMAQKEYLYENGQRIKEYLISSGKQDRTPTGVFKIWTKIRSAKMSGGSKLTHDYYYLPNVPYIMYFFNNMHPKTAGFSLHGTYWHHNFGTPMSHGCINMVTADAAEVFNWADIGTEVRIYGKYVGKPKI